MGIIRLISRVDISSIDTVISGIRTYFQRLRGVYLDKAQNSPRPEGETRNE